MHKTLLILILSTTFMAAPGVMAQTADPACMMKNADGTETVDMAKCPDGKTVGAASNQTGQDNTAAGQTGTAPAPDTTASTTPSQMPGNLTIAPEAFAGAKIISANDFIGKRIYSNTNEDIGEVNDLIISDNGNVRAVIVGVGGFLGIGEKDVAVDMASVTMTPDGNSTKLTMNVTKDQLTSAPQYDRASRNYMQR
jgi:sporulation protein YlmC with PRC-barrel domain